MGETFIRQPFEVVAERFDGKSIPALARDYLPRLIYRTYAEWPDLVIECAGKVTFVPQGSWLVIDPDDIRSVNDRRFRREYRHALTPPPDPACSDAEGGERG